jgi:hypothetical protein
LIGTDEKRLLLTLFSGFVNSLICVIVTLFAETNGMMVCSSIINYVCIIINL